MKVECRKIELHAGTILVDNRRMGSVRTIAMVAAAGLFLFAAAAQQPMLKPSCSPEVLVDINHATVEELMKVPGMTRVWAARVVRFRPYRAKNDLLDRGVLPSDVYSRIKESIVAHRDKQ
jgi:DNA uptake protein ComE-like DNA-binding protein